MCLFSQSVSRSYDVAKLMMHPDQSLGRYLIAKQSFARDEPVMEYIGFQYTNTEAKQKQMRDARCGRLISYQTSVGGKYIVDPSHYGNLARFANCSHDFNMVLRTFIVDGVYRVFYVAHREIKVGNELLASYGDGYCDNNGVFVECKCQSKRCSGFISIEQGELGNKLRDHPLKFPFIRMQANQIEMMRDKLVELELKSVDKDEKIEKLEEEVMRLQEEATSGRRVEEDDDTDVEMNELPEVSDDAMHSDGDTDAAGALSEVMEDDGDIGQANDQDYGRIMHDCVSRYRDHEKGVFRSLKCAICSVELGSGPKENGSAVRGAVIHFIKCGTDVGLVSNFFILEKELKMRTKEKGQGYTDANVKKALNSKGWYDAVSASVD